MIIGSCKVYLTAEWVYSLKEKRMVVKSLTERMRNKFNIAVAEVERQDVHRSIVIGFVCLSNERPHVESMIESVLRFMEAHTDAVIDDIVTELIQE